MATSGRLVFELFQTVAGHGRLIAFWEFVDQFAVELLRLVGFLEHFEAAGRFAGGVGLPLGVLGIRDAVVRWFSEDDEAIGVRLLERADAPHLWVIIELKVKSRKLKAQKAGETRCIG